MEGKIFIAVQCCQCSMMQVKGQKKSSNKWTCVVCNQKQSVRKVFAQGYMAKDLRQFVQSFNMSQKDQTLSQGCGFESRVETEILIKKPKLSSNGTEPDTGDGEGEAYSERDSRICAPTVTKPASKWSKYMSEDDMEPKTCQRKTANASSNWSEFMTKDEDEKQRSTHQPTMTKGASKLINYTQDDIKTSSYREVNASSKWREFITEDEDEEQRRTHQPTMTKGALKQKNYSRDDIKPRSYQEKVAKAAFKWDDYLTEEEQRRTHQPTMRHGASKQNNYTRYDINPGSYQEKVAKAALKWGDYLTEDDGEGQQPTTMGKSASKWNSYLTQDADFKTIICDQRVDDDIHPDFI